MGRASVGLISAAAQHDEHVYSAAEGATPASGVEELSISWQRSARSYGVDPADRQAPRILAARELQDFREPLGKLIFAAQEEIDRLYKTVRQAGYTILFCDTAGVAVEHRGDDADASRFRYWEPGSAAYGRRRPRARTASAPASPRSGPSPFTGDSTSDRGTRT